MLDLADMTVISLKRVQNIKDTKKTERCEFHTRQSRLD